MSAHCFYWQALACLRPVRRTRQAGRFQSALRTRRFRQRAADNPAKQPVQVQNNLIQSSATSTLYTVPAGKRLVIEYVNAYSNVKDDPDEYTFAILVNELTTVFTIVPNGSPYVSTSQKVLLYADAGSQVQGFLQHNGSNPSPADLRHHHRLLGGRRSRSPPNDTGET